MRNKFMLCMLAACVVAAVSCTKADETAPPNDPEGNIPVRFSLNTEGLMASPTKAPSVTYSPEGFSILAFKQSGSQWLFLKELTLNDPVFTPSATGGRFTAATTLDEGTYRFLPVYGFNAPGTGFTVNGFTSGQAWDDSAPVLIDHTAGSLPEIFTPNSNFDGISDYSITAGTVNTDYTATISRAVARVDVLITRATGTTTNYTESPNEISVFGDKQLVSATMEFSGMNSGMNYLGALPAATPIFDYTYMIGAGGDAPVSTEVLIGTAPSVTAGSTYGTPGYQRYNAVAATEVLQGAAHMYGPLVIPNADATPVQSAVLTFTDNNGTDRRVVVNAIPLQRNYVTIIKVILLDNGTDPVIPDIWSQDVNFAVTLDTRYTGYRDVNGGMMGS